MSGTLDLVRQRKLPLLHIEFPRAIVALHQIEITSRCNLRCCYCPSPHLARPKVDMDKATYVRALAWAAHFVRAGSQHELNLAGIGESTLHPDFLDYLRMAREAVGEDVKLIFATNGLIAGDDFVRAMVPYRPEVWISLHRPEKAALAVEVYRRHGLAAGVSYDPSTNANDWAGQVEWHNSAANEIPCQWLREGKVFVLADGRISTCCLDASGAGVIGHVEEDALGVVRTKPYRLCSSCYQQIGAENWDQARGVAR